MPTCSHRWGMGGKFELGEATGRLFQWRKR
jgi:hypothetical protein